MYGNAAKTHCVWLWLGLKPLSKPGPLVYLCRSDSISAAKKKAQQAWQEYARARDRRSAPRLSALRSAQELDLAFVVDATGSMGCHVALVKEKIGSTIAAVKTRFPSSKVRVAFIGYRDYGEPIERIGFTDDVKGFVKELARVRVSGGGDLPEDVFSGLEAAAKLGWTSAGWSLRVGRVIVWL